MEEKVSICICTRNRVDDLKKAIHSVYQSTYTNYEIIISDDSTNDESKNMIDKNFPKVKYSKGPQKGLCFNRNNALTQVTGSRVLFMDDDVIMDTRFLEIIISELVERDPKDCENIIISGIERNNGVLVYPNNIDFLGYQSKPYRKNELLKTIVINSTLFPASLFERIQFDEQLVYGYDEVDIAARAISLGYKIALCKEAINEHFPSTVNRDYYSTYKEASRIYVTFKKYNKLDRKFLKSLIYLIFSIIHMFGYQLKCNKTNPFFVTNTTMKKVLFYIKN